jgi:hopene-associated glycosyltransferase HpnB
MPVLVAVCVAPAVAWAYLLALHGGYWRTGCRLPVGGGNAGTGAGDWPSVVAVVPARDEAAMLPETLPSLLGQRYPGDLSVVLVDDGSSDGTAAVAEALGQAGGAALKVMTGSPLPARWAGKVWAMAQGVAAAGECDYLLFTDADIAFGARAVRELVQAAVGDERDLVSQMALLRADTGWERWIIPAFVYFFAQLYPFRRAGRPRARTAAAAGGCMLVRREVLAAAGGLERIRAARIDDIALARLLKRPPVSARCWLGFSTAVCSRRPYPRLADLWMMVVRSAYTQLGYSPAVLAGAIAGLLFAYVLPPVAAAAGLVALAAGGGQAAAWCAAAGLTGWAAMSASYLPILRMYRLAAWRAPALPAVALLYAAMTVDSARRYHGGRGGAWKGRLIPVDRAPRDRPRAEPKSLYSRCTSEVRRASPGKNGHNASRAARAQPSRGWRDYDRSAGLSPDWFNGNCPGSGDS